MTKSKVDQSVMKLLKKVREKKDKIEKAKKRPRWKTNCAISTNVFSSDNREIVNLQTVRCMDKILNIGALLLAQKDSVSRSAEVFGIDHDGCYCGYPIDEWIEDLKTRVGMLNFEKEKMELEELDRRVNKLVTSEQRREMEILELEKILSD